MASNLAQQKRTRYFILDCPTYTDYLDAFVSPIDLRFLRDINFCRQLVMLGYRSLEIYSPPQFEAQKKILNKQLEPVKKHVLYGVNLNSKDPFLIALAQREKLNYQKIISTIIFLMDQNKSGIETSVFIDFEASLRNCNLRLRGHTNWKHVFQEKVKLRPKSNDLSYCNNYKGVVLHNNSDNYIVQHDAEQGLIFMHRSDHKKIFVDRTESDPESNYMRSVIYSPNYGYVTLFDHTVRRNI